MIAAAEHEAHEREAAAPIRTPRITSVAHHEAHDVDDPGELLAHLVAMHDYGAEQLRGGTRSFLSTVHVRAHQRMAGGPEGTVPQLAGSAERLLTTATETLEAILPLDRALACQGAARWGETLTAIAR